MTGLVIAFTVPGNPRPKGRPRFAKGHAYTPKATVEHEAAIGWAARAHFKKPLEGPLHVTATFFTGNRRRADLDNFGKLALDSCNGIAWLDDSQIVRLELSRHIDKEHPRTEIVVSPVCCSGEAPQHQKQEIGGDKCRQ